MGENKTLDIKQRKQFSTVMHLISCQKIELIYELAVAFLMPIPSNSQCIFNYLHETYNFQKAERRLPICARPMISSFHTD